MKLVENAVQRDMYTEKVRVELTVGELLILKTLSGNTNSKQVADSLHNGRHSDFAQRVKEEEWNKKLYKDLEDITYKVTRR